MKKSMILSGAALAALVCAAPILAERTVVLYLIDGLQPATAKLMAQNGATNLKFMFDSGVVAEKSFSPYPKEGYRLENGTVPWGSTSPGNTTVHHGCHLFESKGVDDIFVAARERGIKSVFAGGTGNYREIVTPDYHYAGDLTDQVVTQYGIDHFRNNNARLIRLHPQRIRDNWSGPGGMTSPTSAYNQGILAVDAQLGRLIAALKTAGAWDSTYLMVSSDHGMNNNAVSLHDANFFSSWIPFISFRGPGIKKGETIPYAELADLAIMANHFIGNRPLKGITDPAVTFTPKTPTGSFLSNIFIGAPKDLNHPRYIERFLQSVNNQPQSDYVSYRNGILPFLKQFSPVSIDEKARRDMDMRRNPGKFAIRAMADGSLRIVAPYAFDRVDIFGMDGRASWTASGPSSMTMELPGLPLANQPALVRLHKDGRPVAQAMQAGVQR